MAEGCRMSHCGVYIIKKAEGAVYAVQWLSWRAQISLGRGRAREGRWTQQDNRGPFLLLGPAELDECEVEKRFLTALFMFLCINTVGLFCTHFLQDSSAIFSALMTAYHDWQTSVTKLVMCTSLQASMQKCRRNSTCMPFSEKNQP